MTAINLADLNKLPLRQLTEIEAKLSAEHRQSKAAVIEKIGAYASEMGESRLRAILGTAANTNGHAKTRKVAKTKKGSSVPVKFRNPADATQTWSGRGRMATWMVNAIAKGATKESFAVKR